MVRSFGSNNYIPSNKNCGTGQISWFSNLFILFHPFSSFFILFRRKRMKKAGTGRDTSFPLENLKPVVWPYGQEYPSKKGLQKKRTFLKQKMETCCRGPPFLSMFDKKSEPFFVCIFCCVPSKKIFFCQTWTGRIFLPVGPDNKSGFFCCVVPLPSNTIFVRKTIIAVL